LLACIFYSLIFRESQRIARPPEAPSASTAVLRLLGQILAAVLSTTDELHLVSYKKRI